MSFPKKTPGETKLVTFDFSLEAASGTTLSSPSVEVTTVTGTGADASDLDIGSAVVQGRKVLVTIGGGIDGGKYRISCTATASNGETHQCDKDLPVSDKAAVVS